MAPISEHVQLWRKASQPTSPLFIPCWTHCIGLLNELFAPGTSSLTSSLLPKNLNVRSGQMSFSCIKSLRAPNKFMRPNPLVQGMFFLTLASFLHLLPWWQAIISYLLIQLSWSRIPPPLVFVDPKQLVFILHNLVFTCHFQNSLMNSSHSEDWLLDPFGLEWPRLLIHVFSTCL